MTQEPEAPASVALARPLVHRPTVVSRVGLALLATPVVLVAAVSSAWLVASAAAIGFAGMCWAIGARRLIVDERGVRKRGLRGESGFAWDDITHYTYWNGGESFRMFESRADRHHVLDLFTKTARLRVAAGYRDAGAAIATIIEELHRRMPASTTFGPFELTDDGLRHKRQGVLPWVAIEIVRLREIRPRVEVMKDGKSFPWAAERLARLPNSMRMFEQLADRGVRLDLRGLSLLSSKLTELQRRQLALPAARVVRR